MIHIIITILITLLLYNANNYVRCYQSVKIIGFTCDMCTSAPPTFIKMSREKFAILISESSEELRSHACSYLAGERKKKTKL
jgi:hypothetical protein